MPPYIKGRLDEREEQTKTLAIYGYLAGSILIGAWMQSWSFLEGWEEIVAGILFFGSIPVMIFLFNSLPFKVRYRAEDKIIRLRIALGQWPDPKNMPGNVCLELLTLDKIKEEEARVSN